MMTKIAPELFSPPSPANCYVITKTARNPNHIVGNIFLLKKVLLDVNFFITTLQG